MTKYKVVLEFGVWNPRGGGEWASNRRLPVQWGPLGSSGAWTNLMEGRPAVQRGLHAYRNAYTFDSTLELLFNNI